MDELKKFSREQREKHEATQLLQLGSQLIDERDPRTIESVRKKNRSNTERGYKLANSFFKK
jgi:hypothetical protein